MADKTFGTVVMGVVSDVYKQDPVNVDTDSTQYHQARRYVIDAMEEIRGKRFAHARANKTFDTRDGVTNYILNTETSTEFTAIDRVYYTNSSGHLLPTGGIPRLSLDDLNEKRSLVASTSRADRLEYVATSRGAGEGSPTSLIFSPYPNADIAIKVIGLYEPDQFRYDLVSSEWKYSVGGTVVSDIDAQTSVIFTRAGKLLRYLTNANLYAGPLDDEKGKRQEKWRALAEKELARLEIEKENLDNLDEIKPFL